MADPRTSSARLRAELKLARRAVGHAIAALEFYGDPETYFAIMFLSDPPAGGFLRDIGDTHLGRKPGKRARMALKKISAWWEKEKENRK